MCEGFFQYQQTESMGLGIVLSNASLSHFPATTLLSKRASFGAVAIATQSRLETETLTKQKETPVLNHDLLTSHSAFQESLVNATAIAKNLPTRQATWQELNLVFPDLVKDICPLGYRSRFLKAHQLEASNSRTEQPTQSDFQADRLQDRLAKLNHTQLVAIGETLAGSAVARFMADSLTQEKISPATLKTLLNQIQTTQHRASKIQSSKPTDNHTLQPQFSGFDPFGAMFAVGLTTYVYGKIKQQKAAINIGKTLMLVGIVPNLILMGTAIAALIKVALFGAPG